MSVDTDGQMTTKRNWESSLVMLWCAFVVYLQSATWGSLLAISASAGFIAGAVLNLAWPSRLRTLVAVIWLTSAGMGSIAFSTHESRIITYYFELSVAYATFAVAVALVLRWLVRLPRQIGQR